jgi:hypothetical protein
MNTIPLTKGYSALVDDEDYDRIASFKWYVSLQKTSTYANRDTCESGKRTTVSMHRFIMQPPKGMRVDHINGDGLDNRKANIRVCTPGENLCNQRRIRGLSAFKGVSYWTHGLRWRAQICVDGRRIFLGSFPDEPSAATAYDAAALFYHGEFACTNADLGLL